MSSTSRQDETPENQVVWSTWNEERTVEFPQILLFRKEWKGFGYDMEVTPNADIRLDVERLVQETHKDRLLEVFDSLGTTNMQFDFWRYAKLYLDGGVYADVDVRPLQDIARWQHKARSSDKVVLFEESPTYMANSTFFHLIRPMTSNFQELPSYASCVIVSPGPKSNFFLDLLLQIDPAQWEHEKEPRKTLMTAGPGLLTQFAKTRDDVIFASRTEGSASYIHTAFGTWKPGRTVLFERYGKLIPVVSLLVIVGFYYVKYGRRKRKCHTPVKQEITALLDEEDGSWKSPCDKKDDSNLVRRIPVDT